MSIVAHDTTTPETAEQRHARRRADPDSHTVAVEQAAQAFATCQGWDWPSLSDFYGEAYSGDLERGANALELRRLEMRQKVRHIARLMVDEFERHITHGGLTRMAQEAEQRIAHGIQAQLADDTTRRLLLKPKPISSILQQRAGD